MSTDLKREIISTNSENTEHLGRCIGSALRGGETFQLISDLGGGKTTLTRGIVSGIGCRDAVSSPTFTISKEYSGTTLTIKHYDFYRLADPGIMAHELQEYFSDAAYVTIIEWADIVSGFLPTDVVSINIEQSVNESRKIIVKVPQSHGYILEALA